ncbi:hypothetical protein GCM10010387_21640 [Streptomyces inusitatus]|uniref:DUF4190 domain-containing protein n=1 Tax=Streptomyces inusitatus TaxID=68221 RepID=A0A918PZU5_9ACTN|nr:hypothetical protein [Streptomyces inusitatus]GGZ27855.1 hypothetical protein GCM10010387_21640 [Streptomyces inusitatus]
MTDKAADGPAGLYGGVSLGLGVIGLVCLALYAFGVAPLAFALGPLAVTFGILGLVSGINRAKSAAGLLAGVVPTVLLLLLPFGVAPL